MTVSHWTSITDSPFPWEQEAQDWLRTHIPSRNPWHAWSNFEFIDDAGKVNEVDTLILSPLGLFLVEIKSRPGKVRGDAHTWVWTTDGRTHSYDNPFILADRKAKRIASLLRRQPAFAKARVRVPWVGALVFLSDPTIECKLEGSARAGVFLRGTPGSENDQGIIARLCGTGVYVPPPGPLCGQEVARAVSRAVLEAGIRPSNKHRQIGDYQLGRLLGEGQNHQDWDGEHVSVQGVHRRLRIYGYASATHAEGRQALVRQAIREFQILEGVEHPGILRVRDFKESELGPALVFDYEPNAQRLDLFIKEQAGQINLDQRLSILRQLAETLKYAHQKKLYHRALCPQSVLVRDPREAEPRLQIMNWQLAARDSGTAGTALRTAGTQHVDDYLQDPAKVYLAPEALGDAGAGPHLDIFSLGAIAWLIFTGQPPGASPFELHERLRAGNGLRLSDGLDGAGKELQDLVQYSTCPDVAGRIGSMDEFLEYLTLAEEELTRPDAVQTVDPSVAKTGDRLDGGFVVVRRLGRGASSDVLLVKADDSDESRVLKVALDATHNDRLRAEGELLVRLHHANIVHCHGVHSVAGRTAVLMEPAGDATLARRLREGRFSLDLMYRFGEELLQTAAWLEDQGIYHRDIKPENIGLDKAAHSGRLRLVLFDFSLARAPLEDIRAGTRPYLDPFLSLRHPPRWDLHAERFAIAMTLYEMVTGTLPVWGDGLSEPALLEQEASLDIELFDLNLRDGLSAFFTQALRRDYRERFDNAEEMQRAWRTLFEQVQARSAQADTDAGAFDAIARRATPRTTIAELGYGIDAQHTLDLMGIHNVKELLAVDRVRFRYLKGVSERVRKEIRLKAKQLAHLRPDLAPSARPSVLEVEEGGSRSIDELIRHLLPQRAEDDERPGEAALALFIGIQPPEVDTLWPTIGDAAQAAGCTRPALTNALVAARARWLKSPAITEVREEIASHLTAAGGVASADEIARALLAARGSIEQDDATRLRLAAAVVRAAVEAEASLANPRHQVYPGALDTSGARGAPIIATSIDHADYAIRLAQMADEMAAAETLPMPQAIIDRLEAVERPSTVAPMSGQRLVRLAAATSTRTCVSSRMEFYPRGMAALRAIRLALGSLIGPSSLTPAQITERVLGRYPEAEPLPPRPALDALLTEAGAGLAWRDQGSDQGSDHRKDGSAYYALHQGFGPSAGASTFYRNSRQHLPEAAGEEADDIRRFNERLQNAAASGGFLALTVSVRLARHAERLLLQRLPFQARSLDAITLDALHQEADALRIAWPKVMEADAADPASRDWGNLLRLADKAKTRIRAALTASREPLLLTQPGLLARFDLIDLITDLHTPVISGGGLPPVWLLVPMPSEGLPAIDGVPIPVVTAAQWARIPDHWIEAGRRELVEAA